MNIDTSLKAKLKHQQHFEALNGLRGIAAFAVLVFHYMEWVYTDFSKNFIAHGFLAVDFFFCLSGFVIAYAYDDRIEKIGPLFFLKSRVIRLHPMIMMGAVLGLLTFLFDPFGGHPEVYSTIQTTLLFLCTILMIPLPIIADRGFNLFGLNAPTWSLFWEYIANVLYAFVLHQIGRTFLLLLAIISGFGLCWVAFRSENLLGGWSGATFWDGAARISYSFLIGMVIYRFNWIIKNKLGFVGIAILLCLAFIMPFSKWNWLTEPMVVLLYFPLLISLGAGAHLTRMFRKICLFLGEISYPLYMTHYAIIWMFGNYYVNHQPNTMQLTLVIVLGIILQLLTAYVIMKRYDNPIRKYLSNKLNNSLKKKGTKRI